MAAADLKLSEGLLGLFGPAVADLDAGLNAARESQLGLFEEIERLSQALNVFVGAPKPPPLEAHVQKLLNSRRKLGNINTLLRNSHERLERISALLAKEAARSNGPAVIRNSFSSTLPGSIVLPVSAAAPTPSTVPPPVAAAAAAVAATMASSVAASGITTSLSSSSTVESSASISAADNQAKRS